MLHEVLKLVTYLSILTTTTSSSYLTKESLVNYRRASPSSIQNEQLTKLSNDGEGLEWSDLSNVDSSQSQSDYLIPQLVNVNNMLYTQFSTSNSNSKNQQNKSNSRKLSHRARGKKDNNNKLIISKNNKLTNLIKNYDNLNKRNKVENSLKEESNNNKNASEKVRTIEGESENKINLTKSSHNAPKTSYFQSPPAPALTNEYPMTQVSSENEQNRELQQLFGMEGAKKFQTYQLHQQMLNNNNEEYQLKPDDEGVEIKEPQKKRNGDMNEEEIQDVPGAMANQIMPRTTRRQREYDVPLIRK